MAAPQRSLAFAPTEAPQEQRRLRIPGGLDQRFQLDPITCSDQTRSRIPADSITRSDGLDRGFRQTRSVIPTDSIGWEVPVFTMKGPLQG
jgi:hypothetical protein